MCVCVFMLIQEHVSQCNSGVELYGTEEYDTTGSGYTDNNCYCCRIIFAFSFFMGFVRVLLPYCLTATLGVVHLCAAFMYNNKHPTKVYSPVKHSHDPR